MRPEEEIKIEQRALIKEKVYKVEINTFDRNNEDKNLTMNDIARVKISYIRPSK